MSDPFLSNETQQSWLRARLDLAVDQLGALGEFHAPMIEVKPAWAAPGHFLIGMAREQGEGDFRWFIVRQSGALDVLPGTVAAAAREVARHFAMKWQLDATRLPDPDSRELVGQAEHLYRFCTDDKLWPG